MIRSLKTGSRSISITMLALLLAASSFPTSALGQFYGGCTVFSAARNGEILAASNRDWDNLNLRIMVLPASDGKHGRIYLGYQFSDGFGQVEGVNDQGLMYAGASLPYRDDVWNYSHEPIFRGDLPERILEECATVAEASAIYTTIFSPHWRAGHSMYADRNGKSVIFEFGERDMMAVPRFNDYQIMTNFHIADTTNRQWYNCYRYRAVDYMLGESEDISVDLFARALDAAHSEGGPPTIASSVYDLERGEITYYLFHNYGEHVTLNVVDELQKGEHAYVFTDLFHQLRLDSPDHGEMVDPSGARFVWYGDADLFDLYVSIDPEFSGCTPVRVEALKMVTAGQSAFFLFPLIIGCGIMMITWLWRQRMGVRLSGIAVLCILAGCGIPHVTAPNPPSARAHQSILHDLQPGVQYYWKVVALGDNGINSESMIHLFKTGE